MRQSWVQAPEEESIFISYELIKFYFFVLFLININIKGNSLLLPGFVWTMLSFLTYYPPISQRKSLGGLLTEEWAGTAGGKGHSLIALHGQGEIGHEIDGGVRHRAEGDVHEFLAQIQHGAHNGVEHLDFVDAQNDDDQRAGRAQRDEQLQGSGQMRFDGRSSFHLPNGRRVAHPSWRAGIQGWPGAQSGKRTTLSSSG